MPRQISLSRANQRVAGQGYQVTYTAVGTSMPSEIFVIYRRPANPTQPGGSQTDLFNHVATPTELLELPIGAPLAGSFDFRVGSFTKTYQTVGSTEDDGTDLVNANEDWEALTGEVDGLIAALNAADQQLPVETIVLNG